MHTKLTQMTLTKIGHSGCSTGPCPTFFKTDRDTFVLQGYVLSPHDLSTMGVPGGETAVEVPAQWFRDIMTKALNG